MKLYTMPGTCALSVHIALEWSGAAYDLEVMPHGDNRKAAYLAINPSGQVPAIVLDDGRILTQASALLAWVADSNPDADLGARSIDERFALGELLARFTSEAHASLGPFFGPARFIDDEAQFDALKAASLRQYGTHLTAFDTVLGDKDFSLFDRRTVADAYLYVLTRWADNLADKLDLFPNLGRFRTTCEQDNGVRAALAAQAMPLLG